MSDFSLFLCGDVMTGRGIDQILAQPSEPQLYESYVKNAKTYVDLAEEAHGEIPRQVQGSYPWGDGLKELKARKPFLKIINLETSITQSNTAWPAKGINYRMHPANIEVLTEAQIDVCALANNHVLDWGEAGFRETLTTLEKAKIAYAGGGLTSQEAKAPAIFSLPDFAGRVLIFSMGMPSSGIPLQWEATKTQPGVWLLPDLSLTRLESIRKVIETYRKSGDLCLISIHWGGNWGYQIPDEYQLFAHALIDELAVNVVHGHSSHHPKGIEIYKDSAILYGCGDLINDYEGIEGFEQFRDELALMYFLTFDEQLRLSQLELVPFERKKFSLHYAKTEDSQWITRALESASAYFSTSFCCEGRFIRAYA